MATFSFNKKDDGSWDNVVADANSGGKGIVEKGECKYWRGTVVEFDIPESFRKAEDY